MYISNMTPISDTDDKITKTKEKLKDIFPKGSKVWPGATLMR